MTAPVFLVGSSWLGRYGVGQQVRLDGDEARHAVLSQRRRPGERVDIVDGAGLRVECQIVAVEQQALQLLVLGIEREAAPNPSIVLVQALAKGDRDERAVEAATELGARIIVPWQANRSIVIWRGERAARNRWRWQALARAATKQSRRAWLPVVYEALDSTGLAAWLAQRVAAGSITIVLDEEGTRPLREVLGAAGLGPAAPEPASSESVASKPTGAAPPTELILIVGPEGGIDADEMAALTAAGARPARLGRAVLRTSTAGPAAIAAIQALLDRWT